MQLWKEGETGQDVETEKKVMEMGEEELVLPNVTSILDQNYVPVLFNTNKNGPYQIQTTTEIYMFFTMEPTGLI